MLNQKGSPRELSLGWDAPRSLEVHLGHVRTGRAEASAKISSGTVSAGTEKRAQETSTFRVVRPSFTLPLVQLDSWRHARGVRRPFNPCGTNRIHETPLEERVCFRNASGDTSGFVESVRLMTKGRNSSATDDLRGEGGAHSRAGGENPAG